MQANSRCLLACSFVPHPPPSLPLSFVYLFLHLYPFSVVDLIQRDHPDTHSTLCSFALPAERRTRVTLFGRDKRGSTYTNDIERVARARALGGGGLIAGVSLRLSLRIVPINYDR